MNKNEKSCYDIDASRINGNVVNVFQPTNIDEIIKIINEAISDIVPRGSGTNLVGSSVPLNSVIVDMRRMNKVTNFDPVKKTIIVESGATVKELNEKLKQINKEFPIYFNEQSTIGSMIANNCIGDKSMRYGVMKDNIEEVEFINGRGELIKLGKADISDVCGMEGITGIIIKAKLKLINLTQKSLSIFQSDNLDDVLSMARRLKSENEIDMLKLYSKKTSLMLGFPEKFNVIIGFDSERGKIKGNEYDKIIKIIKNEYYYIYKNKYYESEDVKLFYDKLKEFITTLEDLDITYLGDLGMAILNTFFKEDEKEKKETVINLMKRIVSKKGKYGIGIKRKYFIDPLDKKIIIRIKKRYDPFGKFNRGKLIDYPYTKDKLEKIEDTSIEGEEITTNEILKELKVIGDEDRNKPIIEKNLVDTNDRTKIQETDKNQDINLIRNVMLNNYKKNNEKTAFKDYIDKSIYKNITEKELINRIMTNKLAKIQEIDDKGENKKGENKNVN